MQKNNTRYAVGAVIVNDAGQVLLVHKVKAMESGASMDSWDFPKGGVKPGESFEEAAAREITEEIGASQFTVLGQFPDRIRFDFSPEYTQKTGFCQQETVMFKVHCSEPAESFHCADEEISGYRFVSADEVGKILQLEETLAFWAKYREMFKLQ